MKKFIFLFGLVVFGFTQLNYTHKTKKPIAIEKSNWQKFKDASFDTAVSLKNDLHFNMTDLQVYDGLMKVYFMESKFKGSAINGISNATGIIQFMPSTIKRMKLPKNIGQLSELEQLEYVSKYVRAKFKEHRMKGAKIDSFIDLYMIVFAPAYANKPDNSTVYKCVSYKKCSKKKRKHCAYHSNRGYDTNKDGKIYKCEIRDYVLNKHYKKPKRTKQI